MSVLSSTVPVTTPAAADHDPAWVVQRAWSVFRLPRLQELIRITIVDLHALEPRDLPGHELERTGNPACDPIAEALHACCEELREAAGITGADVARAEHCDRVRSYMRQEPAAWCEAFTRALNGYRKAASRSLESIFARSSI